MLRKKPTALALALAWGIVPAIAHGQQQATPVVVLKETTVSATRTERNVDDVPATVTVIDAAQIEREGARDLKDLFRNELDVDVHSQPTRFTAAGAATGRGGNEGINIRGLEGNQVLMLVDGIRVPNSFSFGAFATGRGDFMELDGLKSVEVLRGPASTQFGSDGLAGAVSFRTIAPADVLKPGSAFNGSARAGYASVDRSANASIVLATRADGWQGLLLGSVRDGHELDNKGTNDAQNASRTTANPLSARQHYLLAKLLRDIDAANQVGITVESQRRTQDTEVYSARALPPLASTSAIDLDTRDHIDRDRVSLQQRYVAPSAGWLQRIESSLYWQDAKVSQRSLEDRYTAADRTRLNTYTTRVVGLSTLLESTLRGGDVAQRLSYGLDWSRADVTGIRDGSVPPFGETFPAKPFPDTRYTLFGAFVQDEIETESLSIIPGLRIDRYKLEPSSGGYVGGAVATLSDHALTPRLGVVWRVSPAFAPYAQAAGGFRAPTPDQVNNGFTNLASGYTSVGNATLKAEHARSVELGVRGTAGAVRWSGAAFDNRYRDFISQQVVGGAGSPSNPTIFQYINLARAHIRGAEARAAWQIDSRWLANAGIAFVKGDSEAAGVSTPLDTVNPLKAVLALRYDAGQWGGRANLQYNQGKQRERIAPAATPQFAPASSTVLDLGLFWKPAPQLTVTASLNNVFDTRYWRWSDVRGLAENSTIKDAYTAPGRNAQASIRYDF